jgi:UDP-N-acetylmuramyl pentapeptide phosphotransferase/UDP-N-acetylglucosamine-1-phosphate transferase
LAIVPAGAGFAAAFLAAPAWERCLRGPGWIDTPRPERYAKRPVSRAGGAAWLTGLLAGMAAGIVAAAGALGGWDNLGARHPSGAIATGTPDRCLLAFAPSGIVGLVAMLAFVLGRFDDRNLLQPRRKWMLQVALLAAGALWLLLAPGSWGGSPGVGFGTVPADPTGNLLLLAVVFSVAAVLQVALEILDHLDGLLAVHAMAGAAALALAAAPGWIRDAGLAGCGASLGFLCWNRPPARLYFGNAGSLAVATFLPLLLIALAMQVAGGIGPEFGLTPDAGGPASVGANGSGVVSPWHFLAVLPVFAWPLLDLAVVTLARLRRGSRPWIGGCDHLAHRLARRFGSDSASLAVGAVAAAAGFLLAATGLR